MSRSWRHCRRWRLTMKSLAEQVGLSSPAMIERCAAAGRAWSDLSGYGPSSSSSVGTTDTALLMVTVQRSDQEPSRACCVTNPPWPRSTARPVTPPT
jgi:hypothetical protein